jgi:hypothetical protein
MVICGPIQHPNSMSEDQFIEWFVQNEGDIVEAREDLWDRFELLLERVELSQDDWKVDYLRRFLFEDYEPI